MAFAAGRALEAQRGSAGGIAQRLRGQVIDPEELAAQQALSGAEGEFNRASAPADPTEMLAALQSDPSSITADPQRLAAYNALRSGVYGGPNDLSGVAGYQGALQRLGAARATINNTQSAGGREELLGRLGGEGRLRQTAGTRGLDEGILSQDRGALDQLRGAGTQPLDDAFSAAGGRALGRAQAGRDAAQFARTQLLSAEDAAEGGLRGGLESRLGAGQAAARDRAAQVQALLRAGAADAGLAGELGIDEATLRELQAAEGSDTFNQLSDWSRRAAGKGTDRDFLLQRFQGDITGDPGVIRGKQHGLGGGAARFVTAGGPQSIEDVADAGDRARSLALQQLSGRPGVLTQRAEPTVGALGARAAGPTMPAIRQLAFDQTGALSAHSGALDRAQHETGRAMAFNARSGSGTALKRYGGTALGGAVVKRDTKLKQLAPVLDPVGTTIGRNKGRPGALGQPFGSVPAQRKGIR